MKQRKEQRKKKRKTDIKDLCSGVPKAFIHCLNYCRALRFEKMPDYGMMRQWFRESMKNRGWRDNAKFEWAWWWTSTTFFSCKIAYFSISIQSVEIQTPLSTITGLNGCKTTKLVGQGGVEWVGFFKDCPQTISLMTVLSKLCIRNSSLRQCSNVNAVLFMFLSTTATRRL